MNLAKGKIMKVVVLSSLMVFVSLSAFGQRNGNNQPYGPVYNGNQNGGTYWNNNNNNNNNYQPQPIPKKVQACMDAYRPLTSQSDWDLENTCRNENNQEVVKNKLPELTNCIQTGKRVGPNAFMTSKCFEESYRNKMADVNYTNCIVAVKSTNNSFYDDQICSDSELRGLIADPAMKACQSYIEKDLNRAWGVEAMRLCKDKNLRDNVGSKPFRDCNSDMKKYNMNVGDAIGFCSQPQPKVAEGLLKIKSCIVEMNRVFGSPRGTEVCIRNISNMDISSKENIACMNNTIRSTSDHFLDLLDGNGAATFMRDLTVDCKKPASAWTNNSLRYINTFVVASSERVNNGQQEIGGLSALAFDAADSTLFALSDQRFQGKNYIFKFDVKDIGNGFDYTQEDKVFAVKPEFNDGSRTTRFDIDSEGMALDAEGNVIISAETLSENDRSYIKVFNPAGKQIEAIELPQKYYNFKLETVTYKESDNNNGNYNNNNYNNGNNNNGNNWNNYNNGNNNNNGNGGGVVRVYHGNGNGNFNCTNCFSNNAGIQNGKNDGQDDQDDKNTKTRSYIQRTFLNNQGVSENKGFESLTLSRDGKALFTATEQPLRQDRIKNGNFVRILRLEKSPTWKPVAEFLYKLEDDVVDNGMSEMLSINNDELFTLERSFNPQTGKITARIFRVSLKGAVNILENEGFLEKGFKLQPVKKELVVDLDSVINSMPAGLRKLDNFEGLAFGPKLSNGNDTLMIVSDNNMTTRQRTLIMSFEFVK